MIGNMRAENPAQLEKTIGKGLSNERPLMKWNEISIRSCLICNSGLSVSTGVGLCAAAAFGPSNVGGRHKMRLNFVPRRNASHYHQRHAALSWAAGAFTRTWTLTGRPGAGD